MKRISQKDFFHAALFSLFSAFCLALTAALWKYLTAFSSLQTTLFIRFFFPFLFVGFWIVIRHMRFVAKSIKLIILRSFVVFIAQYAFLFVLAHDNLLKATLLYSTSGLFLPILMYVFLGVKASNKAIISILISFIGVAIALGTWQDIASPISLVGLASGFFTAVGQMVQHRASKSDHPMLINLGIYGFCSAFGFILLCLTPKYWEQSILFFKDISFFSVIIIFSFSVLSIFNQTFKNIAYKYVNKPSSLVSFFYATIVFSGLIDWFWLGVIPYLHTIIGSIIVLLGGMIMSVRKV